MKSERKQSHQVRAMGFVAATLAVATPSIGCSEAHEGSRPDAAASTDAAMAIHDAFRADAGASPVDASMPVDVAVALDTPPLVDAFLPDDAGDDAPDTYPWGIRG